MDVKDKSKANILRGVNKKIKIKGIRIAIISIISCMLVAIIAYLLLFVKQKPFDAETFKDVEIEIKMQTINQLNDKELPYNSLNFVTETSYSLIDSNIFFYAENNDDNTSTLYFYSSQSYMQKKATQRTEKKMNTILIQQGKEYPSESIGGLLLYPELCKAEYLNEITKVYYLVYNYDKFNQQDFEKIKSRAVLLWAK